MIDLKIKNAQSGFVISEISKKAFIFERRMQQLLGIWPSGIADRFCNFLVARSNQGLEI